MLCAQAMVYNIEMRETPFTPRGTKTMFAGPYDSPQLGVWNPLHDDAQAMALVKKFRIAIWDGEDDAWFTSIEGEMLNADGGPPKEWEVRSSGKDLNRAICECVAQLQDKTS